MVAVSSYPCYCMRAPVTTITRERLVTLAAERNPPNRIIPREKLDPDF